MHKNSICKPRYQASLIVMFFLYFRMVLNKSSQLKPGKEATASVHHYIAGKEATASVHHYMATALLGL